MTYSNPAAHSPSSLEPNPKDLETAFKLKLEKFARFAKHFGLIVEPYSDLTWPKFRSLSGPLQRTALESFSSYQDLCSAAAESGIAMNDDRSLAWWAVQKFGLRPCSDFFDKLTTEHVLEIYDRNSVQIYRNWAFFQISSYSIGDLFVYSWPDLYHREATVMENLWHYANLVLSSERPTTIACVSPRHLAIESLSADLNVLDMEVNFVSPLFNAQNEVAAFFVVSSVKKICQQNVTQNNSNEGDRTPEMQFS